MLDPFFVRGLECIGNLPRDCEGLFQRDRASFETLGQRWAINQLHHEIIRPNVVEMANVGMVQCRNSPSFTLETLRETFGGNLDSNFAIKACVACPVNFTHAALAD